jgi:hypothetical protein
MGFLLHQYYCNQLLLKNHYISWSPSDNQFKEKTGSMELDEKFLLPSKYAKFRNFGPFYIKKSNLATFDPPWADIYHLKFSTQPIQRIKHIKMNEK